LPPGPESWEVATARNAEEALQLLERSFYDVVASDWIMPGMDGAALMREVKRLYPRSSRIIISVVGDQEKVARSLGDTHQFISKPFEVDALKSVLTRICGLDTYLRDQNLRTLVGRLGSLPSFPTLYGEIMKELASPNSSIERVAAIVTKDPAMTAKMLQIVNSAIIGLAHRVSNPFEAVEYLGLGMVRSLALTAHVFSCFERTEVSGSFVNQLWNHSIRTGMLAQRIMQLEQAGRSDCEDAYVAGMLHDVGKLMLASGLPKEFGRALAVAIQRNVTLYDAELEVCGATHAGAAAYLLGLWGLAATIVEAVAFHHHPDRGELRSFGLLTAVHAANVLEQEHSRAQLGGRPPDLDLEYLAVLGVRTRLEAWREEAAILLESKRAD
jgi:HD-like signal output (HDOD) protein